MTTQALIVDGQTFVLGQLNQALDRWLTQGDTPDAYLIYVHGKGEEPEKTKIVLPDLIAEYGLRPLVLNWEPSTGLFPRAAAEASGPALVEILEVLKPRPRPARPMVLLTQSMGNFAAEHLGQAVARGKFDLPIGLLATIVLNAAAVEAQNHDAWLQSLATRSQAFVIANSHDNILRSLDLIMRKPLGRDPSGVDLAAAAYYLDISGYNRKFHRYFRPNDEITHIPAQLRLFFNQVLRAQPPNLGGPPFTPGRIRALP